MQFTLSSKDFKYSLITGLTTGLIVWRILVFLKRPEFFGVSFGWLIILAPILWIVGVNLGYFLGRWFAFFNQFGKYAAIGFTNAAIDFGVLNLMIFFTGITQGYLASIFKALGFVLAVIHGYFWNKYWAFQATEQKSNISEFGKFFAVAGIGILFNVGVFSMVNRITPLLELTPEVWTNVAAVIASALALTWNFIGFRRIVFRVTTEALKN